MKKNPVFKIFSTSNDQNWWGHALDENFKSFLFSMPWPLFSQWMQQREQAWAHQGIQWDFPYHEAFSQFHVPSHLRSQFPDHQSLSIPLQLMLSLIRPDVIEGVEQNLKSEWKRMDKEFKSRYKSLHPEKIATYIPKWKKPNSSCHALSQSTVLDDVFQDQAPPNKILYLLEWSVLHDDASLFEKIQTQGWLDRKDIKSQCTTSTLLLEHDPAFHQDDEDEEEELFHLHRDHFQSPCSWGTWLLQKQAWSCFEHWIQTPGSLQSFHQDLLNIHQHHQFFFSFYAQRAAQSLAANSPSQPSTSTGNVNTVSFEQFKSQIQSHPNAELVALYGDFSSSSTFFSWFKTHYTTFPDLPGFKLSSSSSCILSDENPSHETSCMMDRYFSINPLFSVMMSPSSFATESFYFHFSLEGVLSLFRHFFNRLDSRNPQPKSVNSFFTDFSPTTFSQMIEFFSPLLSYSFTLPAGVFCVNKELLESMHAVHSLSNLPFSSLPFSSRKPQPQDPYGVPLSIEVHQPMTLCLGQLLVAHPTFIRWIDHHFRSEKNALPQLQSWIDRHCIEQALRLNSNSSSTESALKIKRL